MTITDCCDRCLDAAVDGALNFRDLGGLRAGAMRVRHGLLYRAAMTHEITEEGLRLLAEQYGLRTAIDLRYEEELSVYGTAPFVEAGIAYHHIPVSGSMGDPPEVVAQRRQEMREGTFDWAASYVRIVERAAPALRQIFDVLAAPGALPAVFHCVAGRDRTGVVAALVLGSLGVSAEEIAEDYALTGVHLRPHAHRFALQAERLTLTEAQMAGILETDADAMRRFLDEITRRRGSVRAAVRALGVDDATLQRLAQPLLEPVG